MMSATVTGRPPAAKRDAGDLERQARDELRSAIGRRDLCAGEVAEAEKAASTALTRAREIDGKLSAIEAKKKRPDRVAGDEGGLVTSILSGETLAPVQAKERENTKQLQAEAEALRRAHDRLISETLPSRRERLRYAEASVVEAAKVVVAASGALERLSADLEALEDQVIRKRLSIVYVLGLLPGRHPAGEAARSWLLDNSRLPTAEITPVQYASHPAIALWRAAVNVLTHDADAPLPSVEAEATMAEAAFDRPMPKSQREREAARDEIGGST